METHATYPDGLTREEWVKLVQETRNPFYQYPDDREALIWRYMDFPKFVSVLDSSSLYFPNAYRLGDPFEGSVSLENIRNRKEEIRKQAEFFYQSDEKYGLKTTIAENLASAAEGRDTWARHLEWSKHWTYVSCWHVNEHESSAMWKLYGMEQQSVAIVSTFQRLLDSMAAHLNPPHGEPRLGLVKYLDYVNEPVPRNVHLAEFFCKRKSFEHERELRAVIQKLPTLPIPGSANRAYDTAREPSPGISLGVDLNLLIKQIRVSPTAPDWFHGVVQSITNKYRLNCDVIRSDLERSPVY